MSFSGLRLWKRNLQLLTPFLIRPYVGLRQLKRTGTDADGRIMLRVRDYNLPMNATTHCLASSDMWPALACCPR